MYSKNALQVLNLAEFLQVESSSEFEDLRDRLFASPDKLVGKGGIDRMKRMLSEFVNEAKKLRGCDFQFTFSGFKLTKVNVDQIDFVVDEESGETVCNEYVYPKNYQLIEPGALHFVYRVDYTRLVNSVPGEFPRCFSQKFTDIEEVYATAEVQDLKHFLWFLKSLRTLRSLELEHAELSQEFYDQLPASAHSLIRLELRAGFWKNMLQLNCDFISKFSCLSYLTIEHLSLESFTSLVRSLGKLVESYFDVRSKGECIEIEKESDSSVWKILKAGHLPFETENPDEILNFIEEPQNDISETDPASD